MFGFVGPNGAGKTTTMRIILGVLVRRSRRGPLARRAGATPRRAGASATCRRSAGCTRRCASATQLTYLAALHGVDAPEAAADRWIERLGHRRARRRPRRGALARQPAARPARRRARPRARAARARRALQRPRPGRRRRALRRARRVRRHRRPGRLLQPPARARRAAVRGRGDHQGRPPGARPATVDELRGPGRRVVREVHRAPVAAPSSSARPSSEPRPARRPARVHRARARALVPDLDRHHAGDRRARRRAAVGAGPRRPDGLHGQPEQPARPRGRRAATQLDESFDAERHDRRLEPGRRPSTTA